jgi:hypothetical protein
LVFRALRVPQEQSRRWAKNQRQADEKNDSHPAHIVLDYIPNRQRQP